MSLSQCVLCSLSALRLVTSLMAALCMFILELGNEAMRSCTCEPASRPLFQMFMRACSQTYLCYAGDQGATCSNAKTQFAGCAMYQTSCSGISLQANESVRTLGCLSNNGQSGSPAWIITSDSTDRVVSGIGIAGGNAAGAIPGTFLLITPQLASDITSMMNSS